MGNHPSISPPRLSFAPHIMPAVSEPAKVLISGVNGYLGMWITRRFLEAGYTVRGTVRNVEKAGPHIKKTFASFIDKLELVEVKDITVVCLDLPCAPYLRAEDDIPRI